MFQLPSSKLSKKHSALHSYHIGLQNQGPKFVLLCPKFLLSAVVENFNILCTVVCESTSRLVSRNHEFAEIRQKWIWNDFCWLGLLGRQSEVSICCALMLSAVLICQVQCCKDWKDLFKTTVDQYWSRMVMQFHCQSTFLVNQSMLHSIA